MTSNLVAYSEASCIIKSERLRRNEHVDQRGTRRRNFSFESLTIDPFRLKS